MSKMTKAQARKRLAEIRSKAFKLVEAQYMNVGDLQKIQAITTRIGNRLK